MIYTSSYINITPDSQTEASKSGRLYTSRHQINSFKLYNKNSIVRWINKERKADIKHPQGHIPPFQSTESISRITRGILRVERNTISKTIGPFIERWHILANELQQYDWHTYIKPITTKIHVQNAHSMVARISSPQQDDQNYTMLSILSK